MTNEEILALVNTRIVCEDSWFERSRAYNELYQKLQQDPKVGETWLIKVSDKPTLYTAKIVLITNNYVTFEGHNNYYASYLLEDVRFAERFEECLQS